MRCRMLYMEETQSVVCSLVLTQFLFTVYFIVAVTQDCGSTQMVADKTALPCKLHSFKKF